MDNTKYLKLITSEHYSRPKFYSYVKTFLEELDAVVNCYESFNTLFNINSATGDQLDKIGELVGVQRDLPLDDPDVDPVLTDEYYRKVIQCKVLFNHWDGTRKGLESIMQLVLPNSSWDIIDNQDMTVNIIVNSTTITDQDKALLFNGYYIPKPLGVQYNYYLTGGPLFGYDTESDAIKGWDEGRWIVE